MSIELIHYEQARHALAACVRIDDAKEIADKAQALKIYAQQRGDAEMEAWVSAIKVRAIRRIGELSAQLDGAAHGGFGGGSKVPTAGISKSAALAEAGISKSAAYRYERLAQVPASAFEAFIAQRMAERKPFTILDVENLIPKRNRRAEVREHGDAATEKTIDLRALAGRNFATVYADPPWLYENQASRGSTGNHYVGMTVDQICALPVREVVADNAHLHLWTTSAFLFEAKRVMEAWGFEYRSCYVWVKPQMGLGNYWRNSHEYLLFGLRGDLPFRAHSLMSWGEHRRGAHSVKPEAVRALVEQVSPGPHLELFGRREVEGWCVWGNEVAQPSGRVVPFSEWHDDRPAKGAWPSATRKPQVFVCGEMTPMMRQMLASLMKRGAA